MSEDMVRAPSPSGLADARLIAAELTKVQRIYVRDGSIHGDCSMATVRALKRKGLFHLVIDSPNGRCGSMHLTPLGEAVRAHLMRGKLTDDEILRALGEGGRTWRVAMRCSPRQTTATVRRRLAKLEALGIVARHERYSYPTDIYWVRSDEGQAPAHGTAREPNTSTLPANQGNT